MSGPRNPWLGSSALLWLWCLLLALLPLRVAPLLPAGRHSSLVGQILRPAASLHNSGITSMRSPVTREAALLDMLHQDKATWLALSPVEVRLCIATAIAHGDGSILREVFLKLNESQGVDLSLWYTAQHLAGTFQRPRLSLLLFQQASDFHLSLDIHSLNKLIESLFLGSDSLHALEIIAKIQAGTWEGVQCNADTMDLLFQFAERPHPLPVLVTFCRVSTGFGKKASESIEALVHRSLTHCSLANDLWSSLSIIRACQSARCPISSSSYLVALHTFLSAARSTFFCSLSDDQLQVLLDKTDRHILRPLIAACGHSLSPHLLQQGVARYLIVRCANASSQYMAALDREGQALGALARYEWLVVREDVNDVGGNASRIVSEADLRLRESAQRMHDVKFNASRYIR